MLNYDEQYYLAHHGDVAAGVACGAWPSGLTHYAVQGRAKGRESAPTVDEGWYLGSYPQAQEEIASGLYASATEHYFKTGRYRGYLPYRTAKRVDDAAHTRSRFGGLWTDRGNAMDVVAGRHDLGEFTLAQTVQLSNWIKDGVAIIPQAIGSDVLDRAEEALTRAYHGQMEGLKFSIPGIPPYATDWDPKALSSPAKALDIHWHSQAVRDLIFAPEILKFLHLVFERRAMSTQTLGFWRGSAQEGHQDSAYVNYSLPMQFAAAWIALEDVVEGAGELFYYPGSHEIAEYFYHGTFKGAEEAKRFNPQADLNADYPRHIDLIKQQAAGLDLPKAHYLPKRGDVLIWSADLAHGGGMISQDRTRKSVVSHYCPRDVAPLYFEYKGNNALMSHNNGQAFYTSSHYR